MKYDIKYNFWNRFIINISQEKFLPGPALEP